jgi:hypothetical protein
MPTLERHHRSAKENATVVKGFEPVGPERAGHFRISFPAASSSVAIARARQPSFLLAMNHGI